MTQDRQLSRNFHLREFLRSDIAARSGRVVEASEVEIENLYRLCATVLQPARDMLGQPIAILSGLRPLWLNTEAHGSPTSAHLWGGAADMIVVGMTCEEFARWLRRQDFPVDQVLLEFGQWVHIGIALPGIAPRRQYRNVRSQAGETIYEALAP